MEKLSTALKLLIPKINLSNKRALAFIYIAIFGVISIMLTFSRMKRTEQDYFYHEINKNIEKTLMEIRSLKAEKAQLLSIKSLNRWAKEYDLILPKQQHILIIPKTSQEEI